MESDDAAAASLRARRSRERLWTLAGLLVVITIAWSPATGQIGEDTKNDLYVDAWGLMRRALHLWDPQVTFGMLQNQGYGYLFPMGPFFALGSEILPVWIVQRLWWSVLLVAGYLSTLALLRALGVSGGARTPGGQGAGAARPRAAAGTGTGLAQLGALTYVLAPRVLSTLGAISPEAQTQLLAPAILLPVVLAGSGRLPARRAAALSGLAILACGGVNATATVLAAAPAAIWLVTRRHWWRNALTWWWALAAFCAVAWWLGPLLLLGRYSPPFLDWIESAQVVTAPVGLLDVAKGTTHWLGHLLVTGGAWWPAGWAISDSALIVLLSALVGGLGLAGLTLPGAHRRPLLIMVGAGLLMLAVPHTGPVDSPLAERAQDLLDGPLAPLRNVHKADPLLRLPIAIGVVRLLAALTGGRVAGAGVPDLAGDPDLGAPPRGAKLVAALRRAGPAVALTAVLASAAPALTGTVTTRGTFTGMPEYWAHAGDWLSEHQGQGGAILLPSASFGEYTWGRTIDEPLRSLTTASYAVRDAVPLTPAGTVRFLDEIQLRAQSGRDLGGAVGALRGAGIKYVLLRGDLDTTLTGGPPISLYRSALQLTPGVSKVAGFGRTGRDITGTRVQPVEIYALPGAAATAATLWPSTSVPVVSGAAEALPALQESALAAGPVLFDGDVPEAASGPAAVWRDAPRIETDAFRARQRYFGAARGRDVTAGLSAAAAQHARDYFPWPAPRLRSVTVTTGPVPSASSSMAQELTLGGLRPDTRPYAAVDGDPGTAWLTYWDPEPLFRLDFPHPRSLEGLRISPARDGRPWPGTVPATRVRVCLDGVCTDSDLGPQATPVTLAGPDGAPATGRRLEIRILATRTGTPATTMTGLAEVHLDAAGSGELVAAADPATTGPSRAVSLGRSSDSTDGCLRTMTRITCLSGLARPNEESGGLNRRITLTAPLRADLSGTLGVNPVRGAPGLLPPGVTRVSASSTRAPGRAGAAAAVVDGDAATAWAPSAGDHTPSLRLLFDTPVLAGTLRITARDDWLSAHAPMPVEIDRDGRVEYASLRRDGRIVVPARPATSLSLRLLPDPDAARGLLALEVAEVGIDGWDNPGAPGSLGAPCGQGPPLVVGGTRVPTSVIADRPALLGLSRALWQACAPVELPAGASTVRLGPWEHFDPATLIARAEAGAVAGSVAAAGVPLPVTLGEGGRMSAQVPAAPFDRVLTLVQNTNPGWQASVAGAALTPLTVDSFRQAFLLPAGAAGPLVVDFGPDRAYRWALLTGALLTGALLTGAVFAGLLRPGAPRPVPAAAARPRAPGTFVGVVATVAGGALLAGWVGVGVAVAVLAICLPPAARRPVTGVWVPAALAAAAVLIAGLVHALGATGTGPGSPAVETATRLLTLAAVLTLPAAAATHAGRRGASRAAR